MEAIQSGDSVLKATVIYPSTQAADGIKLARLLVQGKAMSDLVEVEVPARSQLYAPVVTADNVDQYIDTALRVLIDRARWAGRPARPAGTTATRSRPRPRPGTET